MHKDPQRSTNINKNNPGSKIDTSGMKTKERFSKLQLVQDILHGSKDKCPQNFLPEKEETKKSSNLGKFDTLRHVVVSDFFVVFVAAK